MESEEITPLIKHPLQDLDFDRLLSERLGDFGPFQKRVYLLVCLPAIFAAAITLASVFTSDTPAHRCLVPGCDSPLIPRYDDAHLFGFSNFSLPHNHSCQVYQSKDNSSCKATTFTQDTEDCSGILFSTRDLDSTIVTEWDLVCGEEWKVPLAQSVFFAGVLVGAAVYGYLGDLWGRKSMFLVSLVQTLVCGVAAALAPTFNLYIAMQFFTGMGQLGVFQTTYVLGIELVGLSKRVFCGVVIEFFFMAGEVILALLAYWLRDWRKIQLACILPGVFFLAYYFVLPKSIRWLLLNRKFHEAQKELERLARGNKVELPSDRELQAYTKQITGDSTITTNPSSSETLSGLLRRPRLVGRLLNVFLNWTVITMVYYGLSMNSTSLAGDIFLNFGLLSLMEVPGYLMAYFGVTLLGRRLTLVLSLIIGGAACLASSILPADNGTGLNTCFFLLGKFGATAAFGTTYLYTSELFPTRVRSLCVGLSSMCGRIGAILSPYVARLGLLTGISWLPMAVFAGGALTSGLLTLLLPETLGQNLPRSMSEAENLGKGAVLFVEDEEEERK